MELPDYVTVVVELRHLFWKYDPVINIEMLFSNRKNRIILLNIEQGLTI